MLSLLSEILYSNLYNSLISSRQCYIYFQNCFTEWNRYNFRSQTINWFSFQFCVVLYTYFTYIYFFPIFYFFSCVVPNSYMMFPKWDCFGGFQDHTWLSYNNTSFMLVHFSHSISKLNNLTPYIIELHSLTLFVMFSGLL